MKIVLLLRTLGEGPHFENHCTALCCLSVRRKPTPKDRSPFLLDYFWTLHRFLLLHWYKYSLSCHSLFLYWKLLKDGNMCLFIFASLTISRMASISGYSLNISRTELGSHSLSYNLWNATEICVHFILNDLTLKNKHLNIFEYLISSRFQWFLKFFSDERNYHPYKSLIKWYSEEHTLFFF